MLDKSSFPDYWYSLTQTGRILKEGDTSEEVLSDEAFYYIKRRFSNFNKTQTGTAFWYETYNSALNPCHLVCNQIKSTQVEQREYFPTRNDREKRIKFVLHDRGGNPVEFILNNGIEAFAQCISFMEELGNYGSSKEMELTKQIEQLKANLKESTKAYAEIQSKHHELENKLQAIYESKTDLRTLTAILFEEEK